jgi:histone H3/H4
MPKQTPVIVATAAAASSSSSSSLVKKKKKKAAPKGTKLRKINFRRYVKRMFKNRADLAGVSVTSKANALLARISTDIFNRLLMENQRMVEHAGKDTLTDRHVKLTLHALLPHYAGIEALDAVCDARVAQYNASHAAKDE